MVDLWTDQAQRLSPGAELSTPAGPLRVVASRRTAQDRYLVQFEGVSDRTAAERLRGVDLSAEPLEVPGALWVHELVGATVRDAATGSVLGTVEAVEANPASDLLVLDSGALIPLRFVQAHDAGAMTVDVDVPEGLLEL